MKISFISTDSNPTPPPAYGGESYLYEIAKNVALQGHDVTLYATSGSMVPPNGKLRLIESVGSGGTGMSELLNELLRQQMPVREYLNEFLEADVVHDCSHKHYVAEYLRDYHGKTNSINTLNGNVWFYPRNPFNMVVGSLTWRENAIKGKTGWEGTIYEKDLGNCYPGAPLKDAKIVYWGTNTDFYCPSDYKKDDYFLFFSRYHPAKGPDALIHLAKELGFRLVMCGSNDVADHSYYFNQYYKLAAGVKNIEFINLSKDSKHHELKRELFRRARALIFPIQNHEPFGMVVTEALACGTPVIVNNLGAMSEIVKHGHTGYLCEINKKNDYIYALDNIDKIKPEECVKDIKNRFDVKNLAKDYINLYERIKNGERW